MIIEKILSFIFGTIIGSFCNLVILRKIRIESIVFPASHCDSCGTRLRAYEMIPILSFLIQKGRCRSCGARIPPSHLLLEIGGGLLALFFIDIYDLPRTILLYIGLMLALVIASIDLKSFDIYMNQVGILAGLGLVYRYLFLGYDLEFFLSMTFFTISYFVIYKISGGGLGDGDIYFYLSLFFFIPNKQILWFVLISIWLGALYGTYKAIKEKTTKIPIPFCIYIFLSFLIILGYDRWIL